MALQHLRSGTAHKRPVAANLSDGQLAVNTHADSPGLFFKSASGTLIKLGPVHVGTTAPNASPAGSSGNSTGEAWLDTSGANPVLKVWNGSAWVTTAGLGAGTPVTTGDTGTVTSTMIADGAIVNGDINASAGIVDTKLATISTANKVSAAAVDIDGATDIGSGLADADLILVDDGGVGLNRKAAVTRITDYAFAKVSGDVTIASNGTAAIGSGVIVNADINAAAAIADTKLATISTAGKVANSATTATNLNTASAIVARDASGNFTAGTITAALSGNASTATNLSSVRTFALTGDVTGSVNSDLSSGASIAASIAAGVIVDADVNASAAIAGTKVSPNFGSQAVTTTGTITGASLIPTSASVPANGVFLPAANTVGLASASTERLRITSTGAVLLGSASAIGDAYSPSGVRLFTLAGSSASFGTHRNDNSAFANAFIFTKARGTALETVQSGDALGILTFQAANGSAFARGGGIECYVDGTPSSTSMPGRLSFYTTPSGSNTPVERLRIANDGTITVPSGTLSAALSGNASTATALSSSRTFALTGDVTGSVNSDLTSGASITASIAAGVIVNADINASAAIADTKLATISTAGKVSNSATTATSANTASAIVARDANGDINVSSINNSPLAGFRNVILNGDMRVAQRGGSFVSPASGTYTLDRYCWLVNGGATVAVTISRAEETPFSGMTGSLMIDVTTADTSIAAGDYAIIVQKIEGRNIAHLISKPFTLSFWVKSPKTGTHCVSLRNSGSDRSYIATYTVNVANTWEYKTITVSGGLITAGTWDWTTETGLTVGFALAVGSTFQTTADAWQTGNYLGTSGQVNCLDSTANNFYLTGIQLEPGTVATPFEARPLAVEMEMCGRYYCDTDYTIGGYGNAAGITIGMRGHFRTRMRVTPTSNTVSSYSYSGTAPTTSAGLSVSANAQNCQVTFSTTGAGSYYTTFRISHEAEL